MPQQSRDDQWQHRQERSVVDVVHDLVQPARPTGKAGSEGLLNNLIEAGCHYRDPVSSLDLKLWRLFVSAGSRVLGSQHAHRVVRIVWIANLHTVDEKDRDLVRRPRLTG